MPNLKLTPNAVARLRAPDPSGKSTLYFDAEHKGFGVLVSGVSTAKTFVVQKKLSDRRTRRITIGATNVLSLEDARDRAVIMLAQFAAGQDPKKEKRKAANRDLTLRGAMDRLLSSRELSKSAMKWPRSFELHLRDWLDRPLRTIDADMVEGRHRQIKATVAKRWRARSRSDAFLSEPGAGTANLVLRAFRTIWNHVAETAGLPPCPTRRLKKHWSEEPRRERIVESERLSEFYRAAAALPNPRDRDLILLLLFTGFRVGEACALRWQDLDFPQRVIRLSARSTKAKRKLDYPMTTQVRDLLVARGAIGREGQYVFPAMSRTNQAGRATSVDPGLDDIARLTGINVSAHDLRRTWATIAEASDLSWLALKGLMNHAVPADDVSAGYVQLTVDRLRAPAQRVADRIAELCGVEPLPEGVAKIG